MALRKLRIDGDDILRKKSKTVDNITERIKELVEDMIETMYESQGVGLAAPQVGVLRRVFIVDIGDGPIIFINPVIEEVEGEQYGLEGCLSVPGKQGDVLRPYKIKVKATDIEGTEFELEAEAFLARAICHEYDHLEGILYTDKAENIEEI
ncbi:MAG: peptide deformylase [Vallitaleaceae bacterium]|nr:peptide deformylase [Vallitaleaceae bacterium]